MLTPVAAEIHRLTGRDPEREAGVFGTLDAIWRHCVGEYVGRPTVHRRVFRVVADADDRQRRAWLDEAADLVVGVAASARASGG